MSLIVLIKWSMTSVIPILAWESPPIPQDFLNKVDIINLVEKSQTDPNKM